MDEDPTREDSGSLGDARDGVVPPYRLLQKLGEGGMGEVWLAEQSEPVKRRVALKLIKAGMDTKRVIARFEAERQALAMMDHPAIARVYDAGETPRGLPFFAMEYVRGESITTYCDKLKLTSEARLRLFLEVCEGVQHAHQKGIIHRDLKPGNVLVTIQDDHPVPKIIDFGVAKATSQRLTEKTLYTELGVMIGTPEYMSPEQAEMSGLDVDTRTDVYSLGVMLYELLTGVLPFDAQALRSAALEEILRQIREVDPPRPSVRVERSAESSTSAAMRQTDPARLVSHLKGDLDWITMKAIEKDRTRRYGSPSELAADVERHLADQPVLAGPPSAVYRARKFVKRHRFGVSAASLGVSALIAFGVTMAIQARRIAAERDRAERVSEFLQDIFAFANPLEAQGKTVTAREILDKGAAKIEKELEGQPLVQAQLMVTMGGAYRLLGQCTDAARLLQSAVDTRVEALGPSDPLTLEAASDLGIALWCAGKLPEAETRLREVVDRSKKTLGPDHATTLHTVSGLAGVLRELGRTDQAEGLYRDALERSRRTLGPNDTLTLGIMSDLAIVVSQKNPGEAVTIMRDLLPRLRGTVGEDHPLYVVALANFASDLRSAGDIPGATAAAEDAFPRARRVMGDTSQVTANAMGGLATLYFEQGRYEDAEKLGDSWLDNRRRSGSVEDLQSIGTKELIARVYSRRHRYAESERLRLETLAVKRGLLSDANDPGISSSLYNLACITALEGKRAEALDWLRQSVAHGFTSVDAIAQDTDLTSLHGDPAFHAVLDEARRKGPPPAGK